MKKNYTKPTMEVFELKHRQMILCGSGEGPEFGYMPSDTTDMNNMA